MAANGKVNEYELLKAGEDEPPQKKMSINNAKNIKNHNSQECKINRFPKSQNSQIFYKNNYPQISANDWNNWHWQLKNTIKKVNILNKIIQLDKNELDNLTLEKNKALPFAITPYYASLINKNNPLRKTMLPSKEELILSPGEENDPLGEENQSPLPGLVHRYPDRVLFMTTEVCAAYCRYCTRSRLVGQQQRKRFCREQWEKAIAYIKNNKSIRDVILSGGDPLTLNDEPLEWLLNKIREIKHVEIIRIGTKTPAVLPMRITNNLTKIIKKYHPLFMSIHFTHPDELTIESKEACERLANAGIPLGSQTVLLKNINDNVKTMSNLMCGLLKQRVRPYYIYQCDPTKGSKQFRTSVQKGIEIIKGMRGFISGYAIPQYVIDAPGGGGKIPLLPEYYQGKNEQGQVVLKNYLGKTYYYPDE